MIKPNPFRYFKTSPEVIRLAVMMYVRFPPSLRQVEDLLHQRGIDVSYETVRAWWNRSSSLREFPQWKWYLDEVFAKINGVNHYLWRAVDHEGQVLENLCHEASGSQSSHEIPEEGDETPWPPGNNRY